MLSAVVAHGKLYGASGLAEYLFALDAFTGEVLWTVPHKHFKSYFLTVVDGVLYHQMDEGYLYAVNALDGSDLWHVQPGGADDLQYTVADGRVYYADLDNSVYSRAAPAAR